MIIPLFFACETTDDEEKSGSSSCTATASESLASTLQYQVFQAVTGLFGTVNSSSTYPNYTSTDGSVTVTGSYTTYPYYFNFIFVFNNYEYSSLIIKSGQVTYTDRVDDDTSIHYYEYKGGSFVIDYLDETYTMTWNFSQYNQAGSLEYTGNFTVCGVSYEYGGAY